MQIGPQMFLFLAFLPSVLLSTLNQVNTSISPPHSQTSSADAKHTYVVYISYTPLPVGVNPEDYYIKSLIPVLGSDKAAKDALVYSYKVLSGFAARLTHDQASRLQKQPYILHVFKDVKYWLLDDGSEV